MSDLDSNKSSGSNTDFENQNDEKILFGINKIVNVDKMKSEAPDLVSRGTRRSKLVEKKRESDIESKKARKESPKTSVHSKEKSSRGSRQSDKQPEENKSETEKGFSFDIFGNNPVVPPATGSEHEDFTEEERKSNFDEVTIQPNETVRDDISSSARPKYKTVEDKNKELNEKAELLGEWDRIVRKSKDKGLKRFNQHSDIEEIRYEIKRVKCQRRRDNMVTFMGQGTYTLAKGVEILFGRLDIMDVDMDGFSTSVKHNLDDFEDIFNDLYDKYKGSGKSTPPELRFLFMFVMSAVQFALVNKAPKYLASFLGKGGGGGGNRPSGGYRDMSPPDVDGDDELEEMLHDIQKRDRN